MKKLVALIIAVFMLLSVAIFSGCMPEKKVYTITFNDGVGGVYAPIEIKYGESVKELPVMVVTDNKEFGGWKTSDGVKITEGMLYIFLEDIELVPIFVITVTLKNTTDASFTEWADGSVGDKVVKVDIGSKLDAPKMKYDYMSEDERFNDYYIFEGWFYKDKNGNEKQLDLDKELTIESLGVDGYQIEVYAKAKRQWFGA